MINNHQPSVEEPGAKHLCIFSLSCFYTVLTDAIKGICDLNNKVFLK